VGAADRPFRFRAGRTLDCCGSLLLRGLDFGVTAEMSSKLTVNSLQYFGSGPDDLPKVKWARSNLPKGRATWMEGTSPTRGTPMRRRPACARQGEVTAVVYESPILRYHANNTFKDKVLVLPGTFEIMATVSAFASRALCAKRSIDPCSSMSRLRTTKDFCATTSASPERVWGPDAASRRPRYQTAARSMSDCMYACRS